MHDHQSDWKSIYSDLDDMNDVDNLDDPLGNKSTHSLVNSQQLNHAKSVFRQMKREAAKAIDGISGLNPKNKQAVQIKINDLFTRVQMDLQNVNYPFQVEALIHRTRIQVRRIVIIKKFANYINSIISEVRRALLTKSQRDDAISELKAVNNYTRQDLIKSQAISSLQDSYVSGKNSVNGALVKYLADSQINVSNHLRTIVNKVHHEIEIQPNLNVAAKYLAYQQIDSIKADVISDLMSTNRFMGLKRVELQGLKKLKSVLNDKNKVLANLTAFNQFVIKIRTAIADFSELSSNDKLHLDQRIDDYQKDVESQVQQLHRGKSNDDFDHLEHYLAIMVIDTVVTTCKQRVTNQKMKLTSIQQNDIVDDLEMTSLKIHNNLEQSYLKDSIETSLMNGLKRLKASVGQINTIIYQNQIHQFVLDLKSKINQLYELSVKDKHRLQVRIQILSKHLLNNQSNTTVASAKKQLYGVFHKQADYMISSTVHRVFSNVYKQVQSSNLSVDQTNKFLTHLNSIREKSDAGYEGKQFLIKSVLHNSLIVDKNENLQRMTKLNKDLHHRISSFDIASQLDKVLGQDLIDFSSQINDATRLSEADREEQRFESLVYRKLYRLYSGTDSPQAQALQKVIVKANQVHRQVHSAVLDPRISWRINEVISKHTNSYLYQLSVHDIKKLKPYVAKLVHNVSQEIPRAIHYLKNVYIKQIEQFFKQLQYQLNSYSASWRILDKLNLIQSRIISKIKQSNNLLQIEHFKQLSNRQANNLVSTVINKYDHKKQHANQQIDNVIKSINDRLVQIKRKSNWNDLAVLNRILRLVNLAKYSINQCLDSDLSKVYHRYSLVLGRVLRRSYVKEWLIIVQHAYSIIKNLSNVPTKSKINALQLVQELKLKITNKLQKCDQFDLFNVLKTSNDQVEHLINRSIYLDPVKKQSYQKLNSLIKRIQVQIQNSFDEKSSKSLQARLNDISDDIDQQLRVNDDQKVKAIYSTKLKDINTFELKLNHKIQLNNFTEFTQQFSKRLDKMKMLANRELQESNDRFNRYYHKAVYQISHAAKLKECRQSEQRGEKAINRILIKDQNINDSKQRFYKTVKSEIEQAKQQIFSLASLKKKDKHDGQKLLNQIQDQIYQNIKQALSRNQMIDAQDKCHKMVKQVIDKVSSASVLVAAIKSANNQISKSALDKQQKSSTLKQINQIIDNGIKSQFNQNQKASSQDKPSHRFNDQSSRPGRSDEFKDSDMNVNKPNASNNGHHSSFMGAIFNAIKNFFRWIGGMLAKAL